MPTRIHIIHRIIRAIHIQMPRPRLHLFSSIRILGQKSSIFRIIESGIVIIKPRALVIHLPGIAKFNVRFALSSADSVCYAVRFVSTAKALDKKALSKPAPTRIVVFPNASYSYAVAAVPLSSIRLDVLPRVSLLYRYQASLLPVPLSVTITLFSKVI